MIPDTNGKPESRPPEADEIATLLAIELAQRKVEWAAAAERYRKIRTASFVLLALIVLGALAAFFFIFTQLPANRPGRAAQPSSSASP